MTCPSFVQSLPRFLPLMRIGSWLTPKPAGQTAQSAVGCAVGSAVGRTGVAGVGAGVTQQPIFCTISFKESHETWSCITSTTSLQRNQVHSVFLFASHCALDAPVLSGSLKPTLLTYPIVLPIMRPCMFVQIPWRLSLTSGLISQVSVQVGRSQQRPLSAISLMSSQSVKGLIVSSRSSQLYVVHVPDASWQSFLL